MIPRYSVTPRIRLRDDSLKILSVRSVVEGFSLVRDYIPAIDISWDEVLDCLEAESRWLDRAANAVDAEQFDAVLYEAVEQEVGDDFDYLFRGMDVGVAGLVFALAAAGYATCYSCRGHGGIATGRVPQVRLGTETDRLNWLAVYAERAGCGLETDDDGLVTVYASSVPDLHRMAKLMTEDRAVFESLGNPPWLAQALEVLNREDLDESDDD